MRKLLAMLPVVLLAAACGVSPDASKASTSLHPDTFGAGRETVVADRNLFPIQGQLGAISAHAAEAPAVGLWTTVEIEYLVPCHNRFERFTYDIRRAENGGTEILASALASSAVESGEMLCQAFSHHTETVTLPGIASADSVTLINMMGAGAVMPGATEALQPVDVSIISTRSLCPENAVCIWDGTIVRVAASLGCLDKLGPVTYSAKQVIGSDGLGKIQLVVSAVNMVNEGSRAVRCAAPNIGYAEITLGNMFGDKDSIELTNLR